MCLEKKVVKDSISTNLGDRCDTYYSNLVEKKSECMFVKIYILKKLMKKATPI